MSRPFSHHSKQRSTSAFLICEHLALNLSTLRSVSLSFGLVLLLLNAMLRSHLDEHLSNFGSPPTESILRTRLHLLAGPRLIVLHLKICPKVRLQRPGMPCRSTILHPACINPVLNSFKLTMMKPLQTLRPIPIQTYHVSRASIRLLQTEALRTETFRIDSNIPCHHNTRDSR